jgi:PAS domain S-box-containing protein
MSMQRSDDPRTRECLQSTEPASVITEARRLEVLNAYRILDTEPEECFDRIVRIAATLLNARSAYISLVDENRVWFKARHGSNLSEFPRPLAICSHTIESRAPTIVPDVLKDERFSFHSKVGYRSYVGAPLVAPCGAALGALCVVDDEPKQPTESELYILQDLAAQVTDLFDLRLASRQLQDSRNLLDSVLDNIPYMVFLKEASDLRFVIFNKAGQEIVGVGKSDLIGKNDYDLFPNDQAEFFTARDREVLARQELTIIDREPILTKDRGTRLLRTKKLHLSDESGKPRYLIGISEDITDKVRAEADLENALKAAEQANQAKSMFLSRMSHELRTPLNAILGFGQLLALGSLSDTQSESVEQIIQAGKHLLGLINEVLEISRIEAGTISISKEAIPLLEVVESAVRMIEPLAANANVRVVKDWDSDQLGFALADKQRLTQIMINLLSNGVKYNRVGGLLTVRCAIKGQNYRIEVADTGQGINPAMIPRLFTPFDRLGAECSSVEGLGLGLALSQRLAETMGGTLGLVTSSQEGSVFFVEIPSTSQPQIPVHHHQRLSRSSSKEHRSILYIEDNASNTELMRGIMKVQPWLELMTAPNGTEGLELARACRPDLVLLDMHLPDMDGKSVLHQLRADPSTSHIPVIVATADVNPDHESALLLAGAEHYLTKPLNIDRLFEVIDEILYGGERLIA